MAKKIPRMGVCFVAYAGVLIARCINLWRAVPSILLLALLQIVGGDKLIIPFC